MKSKAIIQFVFIALYLVLISAEMTGAGQSITVDSLKKIVAKIPDNDAKADMLFQVSRKYLMIQEFDSASKYSDHLLELSERIHYIAGEADGLYLKSLVYKSRNEFEAALDFTMKYIEIYIIIEDSQRLAKGYFQLANLYKDIGELEFSQIYYHKSLSISMSIKDTTLIIGNCNGLATNFNSKKPEFDSSAYYFMKARTICEERGDDVSLAVILNNLGNLYFNNKHYIWAKEAFEKGLELNIKNNMTSGMASSYNGLGRVETANGRYDEAIDSYNKAYEFFKKDNDLRGIADVSNNSGDAYFKQKKFDLALEKFNKALDIYHSIQFTEGIILTMINISAVYSEMGEVERSMAIQDSCMAIAYKHGDIGNAIHALRNIADNYKKSGNYKNAYDSLWRVISLQDSIFSIEQTKGIYIIERERDQSRILFLEKHKINLEKENLQKTKQRNAYMFTGIGILLLALSTIAYFRQKSQHAKIVAEQKIRQLEEEKKLMAAKLLVEGQEEERKRIATELHDGLGVLLSATKMQFSVISDKSPENKEIIEKASKMLEQASGDVRKISHNMMPGLLTRLGLYEAAEDLIDRIGESGEIKAVCRIEGEQVRLPENKEIMLYRIIQEMVNNTLKHAQAKNMTLAIMISPDQLDITFTDDGKGFDYKTKIDNESLGLKSIQSRVNFLNGTMMVESSPGHGVKYSLHIPV
jgi:signal transduction histidine kinase